MDDNTKDIILSYEKNNLQEIRALWEESFHDPEMFTDYYFENIYTSNRVLSAYHKGELIGMVHLNPYKISFQDKEYLCNYIVGVAVREDMQGKGIMKRMLNKVIEDTRAESPFTFLMPKKQEYYNSMGFQMVYNTRTIEYAIVDDNDFERDVTDCYSSLRLHTTNLSDLPKEEYETLASKINELMATKYSAFSVRDEKYLDLMVKEHLCQHGDVCLVSEIDYSDDEDDISENIVGIFAYDVYDEVLYVERFESFVDNGFALLISVMKLAEEITCDRCVITVAEHDIDDIDNVEMLVSGVEFDMSDGKGIMALPLGEKKDEILAALEGKCFFDEIV